MQIGLSLINEATVVERVNAAGARIMRCAPEALLGRPFLELTHPDDLGAVLAELGALVELGHAGPIVVRVRRFDGEWISVRAHATLLPGERIVGFVVFEDVTNELEVAARLTEAEAASRRRAVQQEALTDLGRVALSGTSPTVLAQQACDRVAELLDLDHVAAYVDDGAAEGMLMTAAAGFRRHEAGTNRWRLEEEWRDVLRKREPVVIEELPALVAGLAGSGPDEVASSGLHSVAAIPIVPSHVDPGVLIAGHRERRAFSTEETTFLVGLANVVAASLDSSRAYEELRYQALHDGLTGLPNRALLVDHLELGLRQSVRLGTQVAVFVCDLDRFKVVNDGLGHGVGDGVLQEVAARLQASVRPGDTVGRFGGDEFVIVCPDIPDLPTVVSIAERLSAAISQPMEVAGTRLVVTGSLGIALAHGDATDGAAGLVRDADAAMYRAKSHGRARYELYDDAMRKLASRRFTLEADLRRALAEDELVVHYQPVVTTDDGELVGLEALVRWAHPEQGLVPPLEFLPVAEESGLLPALGEAVIRQALAQVAEWATDPAWPRHWVAINLHARELADDSLLGRLDDAIEDHGADPRLLRVEITEDAILDDTVETAITLDALRRRGICISIDDFGTGYSSLAYLTRLPVDSLKLDRVFVDGLTHEATSGRRRPDGEGDDTAIASAVVQMAAALHLQVVAEGVETEEQLAVLRRLGCDMVQGFLIAPPMPPDELSAWVRARQDRRS